MSHQLNSPMGHNQGKLPVKVKIVNPRCGSIPLPHYATPGSAGVDLLNASLEEKYLLQPGDSVLIGTGYAVHIDNPGIAGFVLPRSGMGAKRGLVLGNLIGLIDSDYQGEIMVSLWNRGKEAQVIQPMERIAQLVFMPVYQAEMVWVKSFDQATERGEGGFGSTGYQGVPQHGA